MRSLPSVFEGKKVLVTGATGFLGSALSRKLLDEGAELTALVREGSDPETIQCLRTKGAKIAVGDVTDRDRVLKVVSGQDYVFHIAALFRQAKFADDVYYRINVDGVRNVLDAVENSSVKRLVHCSTVGVHSHIINPPANEGEEYRPGDIYQHTKCEGEKLVQDRMKGGKLDAVVVRPAMIWGDGDRRTLKLFRGIRKRRFPIIGSGKTLCHWVYIHDLVEGFLLAAEKENASGNTYIFAGERAVTIEELVCTSADAIGVRPLPFKIPARPVQELGSLVEMLCVPFGIEPPIYRRRVDFFTKDRAFDTTKARKELGFCPRYTFEDEVRQICRWYRENKWL